MTIFLSDQVYQILFWHGYVSVLAAFLITWTKAMRSHFVQYNVKYSSCNNIREVHVYNCVVCKVKSLKIPKEKSEDVNRRQ